MKDNFSAQAQQYAKFRPSYPDDLFNFLMSLIADKETAWDCGTGNGQVAVKLSRYFKTVYATDISRRQIQNAPKKNNIVYKIESAEETAFAMDQFDLITVGQAIHWFNFKKFYTEAIRTLKPKGILAVIGYSLIRVNPKVDKVIKKLYQEILYNYWDNERKYVEELYKTIPFPFIEIKSPKFSSSFHWNFEDLAGYLNTWSAVRHYMKQNGTNPVDLIKTDLIVAWGKAEKQTVHFPILTRIGHI